MQHSMDMRGRCRRRTSGAFEGTWGESKAVATGAPTTRYARSGEYSIAYQVVGEGEIDLIYVLTRLSSCLLGGARLLAISASARLFSRLILMDHRGTGLSDRIPNLVSTRAEDGRHPRSHGRRGFRARRPAGLVGGAAQCVMFAATYPSGRPPS